jgi:predicted nucleic acid-binding protein
VALTHLADTSVLTRLGRPAVRAVLEPMVAAGQVARAGISDLEVGFSARSRREWDHLMDSLGVLSRVETDAAHLLRARQVQRQLASNAHRGRKIPDLLVAAAAESAGLAVLHYDRDFDLIAKATGQPCSWVVPAGSID